LADHYTAGYAMAAASNGSEFEQGVEPNTVDFLKESLLDRIKGFLK
jgi:hypothetical protein